ncbi:hypothetical protein TNCV_3424451 [Trichonephila clavipes]|nr:hypothetical protein TNCV_3424451 [Trichonephila clavipes]
MRVYPTGSIRGTWNHPYCHLQALEMIPDDGNVNRHYSTDHPELKLRMRIVIWQFLPKKKQMEHSTRPVSSALISHWYDSFKADHVQTLRADWSICS